MPEITIDQWLAELERCGLGQARCDTGYTARELMELSGHGRCWVMDRLIHPGIKTGMVKQGRRVTQRIDGTQMTAPVYEFRGKNAAGS